MASSSEGKGRPDLGVKVENGCTLCIGDGVTIQFNRTLRIPDDNKTYPLPPGLGSFPVRRVSDYANKVPESWRRHGGVFLPMFQREAMWLRFEGRPWKPNAMKLAVGKVCALTGKPWSEELHGKPQDYLVLPSQPWLDGINSGKGTISQFIATPLGMGYTVEGQVTGEEKHGGLQICVFEPKAGVFPDHPHPPPPRFFLSNFGCAYAAGSAASGSSVHLFGAPPPIFGSMTTPAPAGGSIFGSATAAGGSVFGSSAPAGGSIFGSAASAGGSIFGSSAPAGGSIFGSAAPAGGSLFGSAAPAGGSLFGSAFSFAAPAGGSLFGSAFSSAAPAGGSLFGSAFGSAAPAGATAFGSTAPAGATAFGSAAPAGATALGSAAPAVATAFGSAAPAGATAFGSAAPAGAFGSVRTEVHEACASFGEVREASTGSPRVQAGGMEMGLGAGGSMRQEIYADTHGLHVWDQSTFSRVFVHLCNSAMWRDITGEAPPESPVSAKTYASYGLPWFDVYDEEREGVDASPTLAAVKTVKEMDQAKGFGPQQDDSSVPVPCWNVHTSLPPAFAKKLTVDDGEW